jgi:plastocyanin
MTSSTKAISMLARFRPPQWPSSWMVRGGAAAILAAVLGCGSDSVAPTPNTDVSRFYWSLTLDQHAINLSTVAPYDTVRIAATPREADGSALTDTDVAAPTYRSTDPARVRVDADGLLHAVSIGQAVAVIATLQVGNITHTDTALVYVTNDAAPAAPAGFSIHPLPGVSTIGQANMLSNFTFAFGGTTVVPHDSAGNPITGLGIYFESSDTTVATISSTTGALDGNRPGQLSIIASTTAFGVVMADTIPFTITMPVSQLVGIAPPSTNVNGNLIFDPSTVEIAAGGEIVWANYSLTPADIIFDDSTDVAEDILICFCGSGNVAPIVGDSTFGPGIVVRRFPVPGTYDYHTTAPGGASGKIIVYPPPAPSADRARPSITLAHNP